MVTMWLFFVAVLGCSPVRSDSFVEARILNVVQSGKTSQLTLDKGPEHGVTVGDKARLPCRDDIGTVTKAFGRRAVVEIASGPRPKPLQARLGRAGGIPEAWSPQDEPDGPLP